MAVMEWRVKSKSVRGVFRVFGEAEEVARDFATERMVEKTINKKTTQAKQYGGLLAADPVGPYQLQKRKSGMEGDDSTWQDVPA